MENFVPLTPVSQPPPGVPRPWLFPWRPGTVRAEVEDPPELRDEPRLAVLPLRVWSEDVRGHVSGG